MAVPHINGTFPPGYFDPNAPIGDPFSKHLCISRSVNASNPLEREPLEMCVDMYVFILVLLFSVLLVLISILGLVKLQMHRPKSNHARKGLFALLLAAGLTRSVFSVFMFGKIDSLKVNKDVFPLMDFAVWTLIPVNALADYFVALVDMLLTIFWLTVLQLPWLTGKRAMWIFGVVAALLLVVGLVSFGVDYHALASGGDKGYNIYPSLLNAIGLFMMVSATMHIWSVGMLVKRLHVLNSTIQLTDRLRRHFIAVSIIGMLSTFCWLLRGVVLLGRAARLEPFVTGTMSFYNSRFTTIYFTVVLNLPCIVVACAFLGLSLALFRQEDEVDETSVEHYGSGYSERHESGMSSRSVGSSRRSMTSLRTIPQALSSSRKVGGTIQNTSLGEESRSLVDHLKFEDNA